MKEAAAFKRRARKPVETEIKILKVLKVEEAVVCNQRTEKAAVTEVDANYMTQLTPSHEQQSLLSFQELVLGYE